MRILRSLRGFGVLQELPDYSRALAKATRLRDVDQTPAAVACLEEVLGDERAGESEGEHPDRAACHLLLAECRVEGGLLRGDEASVLAGLGFLAEAGSTFPRFMAMRPSVRMEVLELMGRNLEKVLDPEWRAGSDKSGYRDLVGRLAMELSNLREVAAVDRLCGRALRVFPGDAGLLYWRGDALLAQGDWEGGLARVTESVLTGRAPASSVEILALMDLVLRHGGEELGAGAEALKGEVYRRSDRWEESLAAFLRAEELHPGGLPGFAVEGLLLGLLRKRQLDEAERLGAVYAVAGFGVEYMTAVASAVRVALERSPDRKQLWLLWSKLCLHLGRLGEALHGVARSLSLDASLAEGILAGCRAVESPASGNPTFRLGLARVMLAAGDVERGLEALRWFDSEDAGAAGWTAACELARECVAREPGCVAARDLLVALMLRLRTLGEALSLGRKEFEATGDAEAAAALSWRVGGVARLATDAEAGWAAREFEIEAWLRVGDFGSALDAIQVLIGHAEAGRVVWEWSLDRLKQVPADHVESVRARLLAASVWRRLGEPERAVRIYVQMVRTEPAVPALERGCAELAEMLSGIAGTEDARAGLATGWIRLGRAAEARELVLDCARGGGSAAEGVLEALNARLASVPVSLEWIAVGVEAAMASGREAQFAAALRAARRHSRLRAEDAEILAGLAERLEAAAPSDDLRSGACQLRVEIALHRLDEATLRSVANSVLALRPTWAVAVMHQLEASGDTTAQSIGAELRSILAPAVTGVDPVSPAGPAVEDASGMETEAVAGATGGDEGRESIAASVEAGEPSALPVVSDSGPAEDALATVAMPGMDVVVETDSAMEAAKAPEAGGEAPAAAVVIRPGRRQSLRELLASETVEIGSGLGLGAERNPARASRAVRLEAPCRWTAEDLAEELLEEIPAGNSEDVEPPSRSVPAVAGSRRRAMLDALRNEVVDFDLGAPVGGRVRPAGSGVEARSMAEVRTGDSGERLSPEALAEFKDLTERAMAAARSKDYPAARELFEQAKRIKPDDRCVRYNLARMEVKTSEPERASVPVG